MTDAEKIKILADALRAINSTIYAVGAPLGSVGYFVIRQDATSALKRVGENIK